MGPWASGIARGEGDEWVSILPCSGCGRIGLLELEEFGTQDWPCQSHHTGAMNIFSNSSRKLNSTKLTFFLLRLLL